MRRGNQPGLELSPETKPHLVWSGDVFVGLVVGFPSFSQRSSFLQAVGLDSPDRLVTCLRGVQLKRPWVDRRVWPLPQAWVLSAAREEALLGSEEFAKGWPLPRKRLQEVQFPCHQHGAHQKVPGKSFWALATHAKVKSQLQRAQPHVNTAGGLRTANSSEKQKKTTNKHHTDVITSPPT